MLSLLLAAKGSVAVFVVAAKAEFDKVPPKKGFVLGESGCGTL